MHDYPRGMAHVGVTVPDIDGAMAWYEDVLGFEPVMGPLEIDHGEEHIGRLCADVLGEFDTVRIGHMATGNQVGFELFEFDADRGEADPDPREPGYFHVCVIDPEIEALAEEIDAAGGEHHTEIWRLFPDQEYRMTYCKDPWGNLLEIYTHGHERIYANQGEY
ncbi:VOC family protein [Natrononativus amylolyticus]|uniref:VOC family protein n=1 Tax=Natrononativus amylolyticus TaxID=2963434 RepID=UPI0020CFA87E|nr:VOC family protein [Natrononativus amylolyticus]